MRTVELLAESRVLALELPGNVLETCVRTLASGGQWERARTIFDSLRDQGHVPSPPTTNALISALAAQQKADESLALLREVSSRTGCPADLSVSYNIVIRAFARQGEPQSGMAVLEEALQGRHLKVDMHTYEALAAAYLKAGDPGAAEAVLEFRDYLD